MSDSTEISDSAIVAIFLFVVIVFIGGCALGRSVQETASENEAVHQGKAEWVSDKDGYKYFQWKKE